MDEQTTTPITPQANPVPAQDPMAAAKKPMPLFLKIMIGCGCLAFLGVPVLLILIVIFAINPVDRISKAQDTQVKSDVLQASLSVRACITSEQAKGTSEITTFSASGCADKNFLITNKYATLGAIERPTILSNPTNNKICVYSVPSVTKGGNSESKIVSWDSNEGVVSEAGKGKSICD